MATDLSNIGNTLSTASPAQIASPSPLSTPNNPINTSQPSPIKTNTNGINPTPLSATNPVGGLKITSQPPTFTTPNGAKVDAQGNIITAAPTSQQQIAQKYQSGLQTAQTSGRTPPTSQGDANSKIQDMTGQTTTDMQNQQAISNQNKSILTTLQNDPGYQQLMKDQQDYLSSQNQKQTLTQQYTDLSKQLGLPALNSELINDKAIIDGTENDIRNEVTKAGGFATESQVQALATARNKVLVQNYNNLLQTRDNAQSQLTNMIGLAKEDQSQATSLAQEKMNFDQQIIGYQQKFIQNAQASLQNMQATEGWDGIYKAAIASGDPSAIARINQTMGPGFDLVSVAQAAAQQRLFTQQQQQTAQAQAQATLANTKATTANTQATTAKTQAETQALNGAPVPGKAEQPGYTSAGVKYTTATAADEVKATIKSSGLTGTRNLLAPNDYNYLKAWWVQQGLTDASFDSVFGGMKDPSLATKKVYN